MIRALDFDIDRLRVEITAEWLPADGYAEIKGMWLLDNTPRDEPVKIEGELMGRIAELYDDIINEAYREDYDEISRNRLADRLGWRAA